MRANRGVELPAPRYNRQPRAPKRESARQPDHYSYGQRFQCGVPCVSVHTEKHFRSSIIEDRRMDTETMIKDQHGKA